MEEYKRPTKFLIEDKPIKHVIPSWDDVNSEEAENLFNQRLNICKVCENFETTLSGANTCKKCGCHLGRRIQLIYPLDNSGKAFRQIKPDGSYIYVCPLKKW